MARRGWVVLGAVVTLGLGCQHASREQVGGGGGSQDRSDAGGASGGGGAPGTGGGGVPGTGGAAGGSGAASGVPGSTPSPSSFLSPAASFAAGSLCEADGWCWYDPMPTGDDWLAAAGAGRADLWIGGASETVLHLDGGHWSALTSPLSATEGIWAASAQDVWFAGTIVRGPAGAPDVTAAVTHWDGHTLATASELDAGQFTDIWGSGDGDVYAVGFVERSQHWDGTAWTPVPDVQGTSVSGSGADDVWIATSDGMWHFDGTSWSRVSALEGAFIQSVAVAGRNDVWVALEEGGLSIIQHFDGNSWTITLTLDQRAHVTNLAAGRNGDVWAGGFRTTMSNVTGYVAHFDGTRWTEAPETPAQINRVQATAGFGDVAVGQDGAILSLKSKPSASFTDLRSGPEHDLTGVWGSSPNDMWAVGRAGSVLHFDGTAVTAFQSGVSVDLTDVWGTAPDDVWIVGHAGTALHFDGSALTPVATGTTADLLAVFTGARGDVWMGGRDSAFLHLDGGGIRPFSIAGIDSKDASPIYDFHGLSSRDIWLSGGGPDGTSGSSEIGFTAHFDGTAWSRAIPLTGVSFALHRIWELAPNDVWVLTQLIFRNVLDFWHFDGTSWTPHTQPASPETFMFPQPADALGSFVFGPHDRWTVGTLGAWERNTR